MARIRLSNSDRRKALMAGVASLAFVGVAVGQGIVGGTLPANAETKSLSLSEQTDRVAQPSFADMVDRVRPAVVSIRVEARAEQTSFEEGRGPEFFEGLPKNDQLRRFFEEFGQMRPEGRQFGQPRVRRGQGSGFIISPDGYVVTNNHVIDGATSVVIAFDDGREFSADVIGSDPKTDLALVRIDGADEEFSYVEFADDEKTRIGDWVVAVGNPYGLGGTVTAGIVSARGREIGTSVYDDFLQIDAPINRGNSGGPTFNMAGQVVGVNTAIFSPSGGSVGIGFAIPASTAERIIEDLKDDGSVMRGWLGVQIQQVDDAIAESIGLDRVYGAMVTEPQAGSPADEAGIQAGDTILAVDGEEIEDPRDLARTIADMPPGQTVDLSVWRRGKEISKKVELGELAERRADAGDSERPSTKPASFDLSKLGLSLGRGDGEEGVRIAGVSPDGPAVEAGLQPGQRLLEVDGSPVSSPRDVVASVRRAADEGRPAVLMRVQSERGVRYVAVELDKA